MIRIFFHVRREPCSRKGCKCKTYSGFKVEHQGVEYKFSCCTDCRRAYNVCLKQNKDKQWAVTFIEKGIKKSLREERNQW